MRFPATASATTAVATATATTTTTTAAATAATATASGRGDRRVDVAVVGGDQTVEALRGARGQHTHRAECCDQLSMITQSFTEQIGLPR